MELLEGFVAGDADQGSNVVEVVFDRRIMVIELVGQLQAICEVSRARCTEGLGDAHQLKRTICEKGEPHKLISDNSIFLVNESRLDTMFAGHKLVELLRRDFILLVIHASKAKHAFRSCRHD